MLEAVEVEEDREWDRSSSIMVRSANCSGLGTGLCSKKLRCRLMEGESLPVCTLDVVRVFRILTKRWPLLSMFMFSSSRTCYGIKVMSPELIFGDGGCVLRKKVWIVGTPVSYVEEGKELQFYRLTSATLCGRFPAHIVPDMSE